MKEHLDQLTMGELVELMCGDTSVLLSPHEIVQPEKLAKASRYIIYEYQCIADEVGARQFLLREEKLTKTKLRRTIYAICSNLIELNEHERVREVMLLCGVKTADMTDQRVTAEVRSRLARAENMIVKLEKDREGADTDLSGIRKSFDAQTAALMAHFKFQIDITTMKASLYAHLVARHDREVKAQLSAMNRLKK